MKFRMRIKIALDSMVLRFRELIGGIILSVFVLMLAALLLLVHEMNYNPRGELEDSFANSLNGIGYMQYNDSGDNYSADDFLLELDCIEAAGTWGIYGNTVEELQFLKAIQEEHVLYTEHKYVDYLETVCMDSSAWRMFDIELLEGEVPEQYDMGQYSLLYLGYEYRDYAEVGMVISTKSEDYLIAGIMKKGTRVPDQALSLLYEFSTNATYSMDYAVLAVAPYPLGHPVYFSIKEDYSFEQASEEIKKKAEEEGRFVTIGSIDAKLSSTEQALIPIKQYMIQIVLVVGLTICIVFTCYQTMSIIMRKTDYGILYANGATTKDLIWIVFLENVIKLLISIVITMPIFMLIVDRIFVFYYGDPLIIEKLILENIIWKMILIGVGMATISSILPICILMGHTPVNLMKGDLYD